MSLDTIYQIENALKDLDIRHEDVRVVFQNGEVRVMPYESCTRD